MQTANIFARSVPRPEKGRIDQLISTLDRQRIGEGSTSWVAEVLGVHVDGQDLWVQIAPAHAVAESIVLRLSAWATPQHAIAALAVMRTQRGPLPHVIDVMQPTA
jgi:hypothetical protein